MTNMKTNALLFSFAFAAMLNASASDTYAPAEALPTQSLVAPDDGDYTVKGTVADDTGEPLMGVSIIIKGTSQGCTTDLDGNYTLKVPAGTQTLVFSYIGFQSQSHTVSGARALNVVLKEDSKVLEGVVVTAMGIVRKQTSLTYATQQVKADELMKVEDPNLVNSLDGKIAGVTITTGAGGAGGSSKILLRGNKSISGNNDPLIVVDGIPMSNSTRNQVGSGAQIATQGSAEGSDPLSQINPDDIESINVLKGANAAALYGSQAANGVVMITTKKGREGRLDVSFNSNVTFDTPFLTPEIQNTYGLDVSRTGTFDGKGSWGSKLGVLQGEQPTNYIAKITTDPRFESPNGDGTYDAHMRNYANNDIKDFYRTGVTTNNSVSLSGGTEKIRTYFSYANSHAKGMIETNMYNRHTFSFRQHFRLWNRLNIDASANYVQTKTKNRTGGGTAMNPIYDLYTMPRNVDLAYYRDHYVTTGTWKGLGAMEYYDTRKNRIVQGTPVYSGFGKQEWFIQSDMMNNPYFLLNQNSGVNKEDRFYGNIQANLDIYKGLSIQWRGSIDHTKYNSESKRGATTWLPSAYEQVGRYWVANSSTQEIYTDIMLMYNNTFKDVWSVNASAGYVGHVTKGETISTDAQATMYQRNSIGAIIALPNESAYNIFMTNAGGPGTTTRSRSSNWDQAALITASVGWKDAVYVDASYRMDWYRAFKQARFASGDNAADDHYGYFGFGANFIPTNLWSLPEPVTYLKYRISYSEVGNSIPNTVFDVMTVNLATGTSTPGNFNSFTPKPETMKSFETGIEAAFFKNALNVDITYYNTKLDGAYLVVGWPNGKSQPVNTTCVRNQGIELTVGYDWIFAKDWRWKTSVNFSYNVNKILNVYTNAEGKETNFEVSAAQGVQVKYQKDGTYGDMYVTDFDRWGTDVTDASGKLIHRAGDIYVKADGTPSFNGSTWKLNDAGKPELIDGGGTGSYGKFIGNMNAPYQLSWSNTFSYKNFSLYFLINGRIGGKVISITEAYLDRLGLSQRTADARLAAERDGIEYAAGVPGMYINEGRDLVPIKGYFNEVGYKDASSYVYDATNFRLRELSLGYTFRDLFGENKNLSLSFIARNLFFIYKDAPVDPDISISTGNSLKAFECFNLPSSRSFGFNLKVNF
ncbi:MAG: SusC/RagA family TonB-linked outer membrane protein [Bacteroidaceae bacterium]|nr:SusC/RagA family TonB-linked outer membrane protein [Bacteroidaceae bacterium]